MQKFAFPQSNIYLPTKRNECLKNVFCHVVGESEAVSLTSRNDKLCIDYSRGFVAEWELAIEITFKSGFIGRSKTQGR